MYCWGSAVNGELGVGAPEVEQLILPTFMDFSKAWNVKQVAAGLMHSLILTEEGLVYSCGNNEMGQLGHNKLTRTPEQIDDLQNYSIIQVAAGDQHSAALTSWGLIYVWGENGFGQLGINSTEPHIHAPKLVKSLARKQTVQIACGCNHTLALTSEGELYSWGQNNLGQLGLGHKDGPQNDPTLIKSLVGTPMVHITAGGHHSAVLTQAGYLLMWGSNKHGQLGYTPKKDPNFSELPKPVPNLSSYSEPLLYVALGEGHTAVLDSNGKGQLYAFGQGMSGQLGIKTPHNRNLPQVVVGPWLTPSGVSLMDTDEEEEIQKIYIKKIFAGGDTTMATVMKESGTADSYCVKHPSELPLKIEEAKINQMIGIDEEDIIDDDLFSYMETVFGSLASWNCCFIMEAADKHGHGLDYRVAEEYMGKLGRMPRESIQEVIENSVENITNDLPRHPLTPESLRCFILLPLYKSFLDARHMAKLQLPYAEAFLNLQEDMAAIPYFILVLLSNHFLRLRELWIKVLPRDFVIHLLNIYKLVIVQILNNAKQSSEIDRRALLSSLKILGVLHGENFKHGAKAARLSYEDFYIPEIAEKIDIRADYLNWISSKVRPTIPISFCEYPFLFDAQAKTLLLRSDATRQMQGAIQEAVINSNPMLWLFDPAQVQFLNINIHRNNIVEDTINQLLHHGVTDYKRPLKVRFIGEEAEDAGGVRKEFFLLLLREILNPDYGMFTENPETYTIWFKEGSLEAAATYSLIGIVCGLAIYNFTIINLPFPLALYKKLLGQPVGLDDLADMDPVLTRSLYELLEHEGNDVEDIYYLNFATTQDFFGKTETIPLKPDGENIPVTSQNKQEYVDLLVDYKLNKSIETQYKAFHDGFYRVCGCIVLELFQPMELMSLVIGNENYNWIELEKNTEYKGEYYADHTVVKMFWEVFSDMSLDQKKKFLVFLTGTDRVPILGMKTVKMIIQSTADDSFLPVAHTCISQLDLPKYSTKEKLRFKLLQAIQQSEGFGLV
ncbi:E3 ubiquitin-protein ligase HERC4-like [Homarus americanus]|uniref:E3 ubiquitin-protein ligase HERC4-like n=1 Tax=Homarus americanus TaxID=6706 RepID=A0A8J5ND72_HOMAM|nr:E3 ubiquitin-protein ligase HERC4-like [Homarus americanus]